MSKITYVVHVNVGNLSKDKAKEYMNTYVTEFKEKYPAEPDERWIFIPSEQSFIERLF